MKYFKINSQTIKRVLKSTSSKYICCYMFYTIAKYDSQEDLQHCEQFVDGRCKMIDIFVHKYG